MKELVIIFLGLIAHFDQPGLERAVLVNSPHHQARMCIRISDLPHPKQVAAFAGGPIDQDSDWVVWKLDGAHLEFKNLPGGATTVDDAIPHLTQITDGSKALLKIEDGVLHQRTSAYVDYTGGSLDAGGFGCPIKWAPPRPPRNGCMPDATWKTGTSTPVVVYTGDTSAADPYILNVVKGVTQRLDLNANAVVWIGNLSMPANPGPHHKDYLWLLDDGNCINEMTGACPSSDPKAPLFNAPAAFKMNSAAFLLPRPFAILDIGNTECSNSHFP